jgi:AraC family transcriptional regulator
MASGRGIVQGCFGRVILLDIDRPVTAHAHPHCHVIIKIAGADSSFEVDGRVYPLSDETVVVVNAWEPHAYPPRMCAPRALVLALYIETAWLAHVDCALTVSGHPVFFPHPCWPLSTSLRRRADAVASFVASGEANGPVYEALLAEFMIQIIDQCSQWRLWRGSRAVTTWPVSDFRIRRAIAFLHEHLSGPPSVNDLARVAGLSRAHFFELFKQHTRMTPHLYYNALRMEAAYHVLPDASTPLNQRKVFQSCGSAILSGYLSRIKSPVH